MIYFGITTSLPPAFSDSKTCSDTWGGNCDGAGSGGLNDAFNNSWNGTDELGCDGTEVGAQVWVREVYINASSFLLDSYVNVTCEFKDTFNSYEYIYYYNGTDWMTVWSQQAPSSNAEINYSTVFKINNSEGVHWVRCTIGWIEVPENKFCADTSFRDNDDVNFTVTDYLKYTSWNINVSDASNLTRSNAVKAYAKWNKTLSTALIQHNGTGSFVNYTVPISGTWTNYTLDLSNDTAFPDYGPIGVSYIWANDTFGLENQTSPSHYFYLWRWLKVGEITVNDTTVHNQTPLQIKCRVKDYHTNANISGYTVAFYENETFLSTGLTNSLGWANITYVVNATQYPENLTFKCNITSDSSIYYNATTENYNQTNVTVVEFGVLTDCSVLEEPGYYRLNNSIIDSTTSGCINITGKDITLDCKGYTIDGDDAAQYGINVSRSSAQTTNITIKNCTVSDWYLGNIYLRYADGNTLTHINSTSGDYGVYLSYSDSNTFTNCSIDSNDYEGFHISFSESNTISNCTAKENVNYDFYITTNFDTHCDNRIENLTGSNNLPIKYFNSSVSLANEELSELILCDADNSNIENVTINGSQTKNNVLFITRTDNSNFTNIVSSGNYYGFYLYNSNSNNISNSIIEDNAQYGIYLSNVGQTGPNKIYNNLFNNTDNFLFTGTIYNNSWNTTQQSGTRIYSPGNEIGGNYWTNPTGDGYSDTCNDTNFDDFCDDPYVLNYTATTNNTDYLPLTSKQKFSEVDVITLNKSIVYNDTSVQAFCRIIDNTTTQPIEEYNVSFYRNESFLGWSLTNYSGYANISFDVATISIPRVYIIKCNITDEPSLGYNVSEVNSKNTTLTVLDLGIKAYSFPSSTTFGNTVEITANISGNASEITLVQANISFINLTDQKNYVQAYKDLTLTYKQSFSSTEHEYNLNYTPEWPSNYSVNITVNAGKVKSNTTTFDVWGFSEITIMTLNDSYSLTIYNNTEIEIECYVEDNYTSSELPDYNVSFYRNNTLLGTNTTNKAGIARYYYDVTIDSSPQTFIFKCNITDEPSKYFNDSVKNYNETTLTVYELGIQALANPSSTTFGNTVEIIANITGNVTPIEFVQANISFTNLTNGQYVQAYETLNLSWKQSFSSTDHEYNFNYTPPRPSNYSVNVTVKAVREKWDTTNFQVWGSSKLDNITVSDDYIYNATSVQIHCLVKDNKTGDGISGYNISFYSNESLLITNTTDNSGWATYDYLINATSLYQEFNIKCNITDDPSKYYNITSEYYKETNVTVVDLSLQVTSSSYSVNYGDSVTIYANITGNATEITSVVINASYINVSNGKLVQASENGTMEYSKSYSPTEHEYNIQPYTPLSSGTWNVNVTVQAGKVKSNTTSINVSFGVPTITFISPNYRIMINQTFTFTANISSTGGDLWYTDLTVGISNESVTNVTGQYSLPDLYNLTSGSSILANWYMESKGVGLTSVVLNVTPQNGSFRSDSSSHKIIFPILTSDDVNITQNTILRTKIIGNITPIDSVNLTVTLPYTQDIFNFTSIFVGNATVSNCTGEAITTGRLTISPNATCSGNNCDYTIDNDTDTSMSLGGATPNLTIILDSEQTIERILLYWERVIGSGNSTIYYNSSGTWTTITELSELTVPEPPKEYTNITGFTPFKTNAFFMNNTPSLAVNIYEFEAYGVLGRIGICYVYEYNFSDTTRSGTYVFDSITTTENATVKTDSTFLVNFGYPQIEITAATPTAILTGYDDLYYAKITAYNGDLRNLSVNLTIYNMSVIQNQTPTTPLLKNVSAILDGDSETVFFNITALEDGVTNTSVWTNSTTNEGYYNQSTNHSIETVPNPGDLPNVTNFWFKYQESTIDKTNLNTGLAIYANVSDDRGIKYVKANVTYPSPENISINVTMAWHDTTGNWEVWNYTFGSDWPLNRTGNYTVRIIAGDIGYQEKLSGIDEGSPENMTFYVNDTYTIDFLAPHPSILMRGESVKIEAKDINGNTVDNINWNVNVTKKNETEQNITTTTGFIYTVKNNDPEVNYSIFANATKDGNSGIGSREFDVNRTYTIELNEGPSTTSPGKGSPLNLYFILSDARGGMPTGDRYGYITCLNMSYLTKSFVLTFTNQAGSDTSNCYAPNTASTQFNIITNVSDGSNNTGEETFSFTTQSEGDDGGDGRRGGGGGPAGPTCTPEADYETNCTDERDNDCDGATDCADADCSDFQACIKRIPDFEFTLSPTEIQIIQGQDADVTGSMSNTGNVKLLLTTSVDVEKDCCSIDIPSSFNVPEKRTTGFNLTIHVNASTQPGDYVINVKISYYNLQNSQSIKVTVIPNDIITNILETLPSQLSKLISEIQEYKYVGVDVSHLEERIRKIQSTIEDARDSVQEDDLEVLKTYSNDIESDMEYVNAEKTRLALQKLIYENKYNITYGVIIGIVFSYLIIRVIAPFIRLSRGIVKLNFEKTALLQSRKQAEKQYFLRKIDEQTFRRIVTEKHSQILKLASTINLTKEQRINLLKKRLNPLYIGEYLKKKLSKKEPKKESK